MRHNDRVDQEKRSVKVSLNGVNGVAGLTKVDSFQISSVFNTQKSFKISLRQIFFSKLFDLDKNICNYLMFPGADFCAKLLIFFNFPAI